jgi:hypothetical protein
MSSAERQRARRREIAAAQGRQVQERLWHLSGEEKRLHYLNRRRQERIRNAAKRGKQYLPHKAHRHDAHVKTWQAWKRKRMEQHDAHVKRYAAVLRAREKYARRYVSKTQLERSRVQNYKERLPDAYVLQLLNMDSACKRDIPRDLIEMKREQLKLRRLSLQLKKAAQNTYGEKHESITQHP